MAVVAQKNLFGWEDLKSTDDLQRLELILNNIPDEKLMKTLESKRKNGRDDYPIRAMWNSLIAGIVFEHKGIESLRRELNRNPALVNLCGFNSFKKGRLIPSACVYSRFLKSLLNEDQLIKEIFENLVEESRELLPDFGKHLALDGKAIPSFAIKSGRTKEEDMRGDHDANWGKHTYRGVDENGQQWKKTKSWFGYTLHLLVESNYGLPVDFAVTKASESEINTASVVLESACSKHPDLMERAEYLSADRGYDSGPFVSNLWDKYGIKPIVDIKNMWKDPDNTKMVPKTDNVVYDYKGCVFCYCPVERNKREMTHGGFEKDRKSLKYKCPAKAYGFECKGKDKCLVKSSLRIPLSLDRRVFTPVARSSYKWKTLYKKRTSVERVNSRLDVSFGFEKHTIRGQKKMTLRVTMAFIIMLCFAVGRIKEGRPDLMGSLVRAG
jgi:hypothetical protein